MNTASFLVNRSPCTTIQCKTLEEVWSGNLANYSSLRMFGCLACAHVNEGKLEPRAKKFIFLGYGSGVGYRLWCAVQRSAKVIISRDVTFDEFAMLDKNKESSIPCINNFDSVGQKVELKVTSSRFRNHNRIQIMCILLLLL